MTWQEILYCRSYTVDHLRLLIIIQYNRNVVWEAGILCGLGNKITRLVQMQRPPPPERFTPQICWICRSRIHAGRMLHPPFYLDSLCSLFGQREPLPLSLRHCHRFWVFLPFWHYTMFQAYLVLPSSSPEVSHSSKESRFPLVGNSIADQDLPASAHIATNLWIYLLSPLNCYSSGCLVEQLYICGHTDECRHCFQLIPGKTQWPPSSGICSWLEVDFLVMRYVFKILLDMLSSSVGWLCLFKY